MSRLTNNTSLTRSEKTNAQHVIIPFTRPLIYPPSGLCHGFKMLIPKIAEESKYKARIPEPGIILQAYQMSSWGTK